MYKKLFAFAFVAIMLGVTGVANAQRDSRAVTNQPEATQYEIFLKRENAVIVTQSYSLPDLPGGGGFRSSAKVAWALGEDRKVYALEVASRIIDFDQLTTIQDGLDNMIRAVNTSFDALNASSMSYSSPAGVSASYVSYIPYGSDKPRRNLYLVVGSFTLNTSIESLGQLRDLISQARQKLISLGAK